MPESNDKRDDPRDSRDVDGGLAPARDLDLAETDNDILRLEDLPDTTVRNLAVRAGRRLAAWVVAGFVAFSLPELSTPVALARQGALLVAVGGMLTTVWQLNGLLRRLGWWEPNEANADEAPKEDSTAKPSA